MFRKEIQEVLKEYNFEHFIENIFKEVLNKIDYNQENIDTILSEIAMAMISAITVSRAFTSLEILLNNKQQNKRGIA